jgi:tetratricopeptide (TPR) repeat protein
LRYRTLAMRLEVLIEVDPSDATRLSRAAETARSAARDLKSPWAELDADTFLACAQSYTGDFPGAIDLFESIAKRAHDLRFGTLEREALINIATCQLRAGNAQAAADVTGKVVEVSRGARDAALIAGAQSVRADALLRIGELQLARSAIDEAVTICMSSRDYRTTLALLRRMEINEKLGQTEDAAEDAGLAKTIAEESGNTDHAVRATVWLAIYGMQRGLPDANELLNCALDAANKAGSSLRPPTKKLIEQARELLARD